MWFCNVLLFSIQTDFFFELMLSVKYAHFYIWGKKTKNDYVIVFCEHVWFICLGRELATSLHQWNCFLCNIMLMYRILFALIFLVIHIFLTRKREKCWCLNPLKYFTYIEIFVHANVACIFPQEWNLGWLTIMFDNSFCFGVLAIRASGMNYLAVLVNSYLWNWCWLVIYYKQTSYFAEIYKKMSQQMQRSQMEIIKVLVEALLWRKWK